MSVEQYPIFKKLDNDDVSLIINNSSENLTSDIWKSFVKNFLVNLDEDEIKKMENNYPNTLSKSAWKHFFESELNDFTKMMLFELKKEQFINSLIHDIYNKAEDMNLYTSLLPKFDGNCLFHALVDNGIGKDHISLRKGLAYIMYIFKDKKGFFDNPDIDSSFNELFSNFNEVQLVMSDEERKIYKFSYDLMCYDMAGETNFNITLTHLLLLVISQLYKVDFVIIHNNDSGGYSSVISTWDHLENKENIRSVYLGLINENHYISLKKKPSNNDDKCKFKFYTDTFKKFKKWAEKQALCKSLIVSLRNYIVKCENENNDNNDNDNNNENDENE